MATAPVQQPQENTAGRGQATIAYSSYIEQQLGRTRKQVKWVEIATHVVLLLVGLLSALLAIVVIDHWIMPLGTLGRWLCLLGIVIGGGYYAVRVIMPLLLRRVNAVYAALAIEQNLPTLKNSLVNLLLLRHSGSGAPPAVLEAVEAQAASRLAQVDAEVHVDRSRLIRLGYVLIGIMALGALYKFVSPKDPLQTFQRVFSPWAAISAPTRVQIARVTPGDTQIFTDQHVELQAVVHNLRGEPVEVVYSSVDAQRRINQRRITLREKSPGVFETLLPGGVDGLQESVSYFVQAGDARSPEYMVTVRTPPAITVRQVEYKYPQYTGRERPPSEGGDVQALVGTVVTLRAQANQDIREAWLDLNCDGRADLRMQHQGRTASVSFPLRLSEQPGERNRPEHDSYQIRFVNSEGHENPRPIRYKINVIPDDPPVVSIRQPAEKTVEVPVNGHLAITVAAEDSDFALSRVAVLGERAKASGRLLIKHNLLEQNHPGKFEGQYNFVPQEHKLEAGDEVQVWGLAFDNKQPEAQSTKSDLLRIKIVAPDEQQGENRPQDQPQQGDRQQPNQNNQQQDKQNQQGNQDPNAQNQQGGQGQQGQNQQGDHQQGQNQQGNQQGQPQEGQPGGQNQQGQNQDGQQGQGQPNQQQQPGNQQPGANQQQPGEPQQNADGQPGEQPDSQNQPQEGSQGMNDPAGQDQRNPMQQPGQQQGEPMQGGEPQDGGQQQDQQQGNQQPQDQQARQQQQQQQQGAQQGDQQGSQQQEPVDPQREPGKVIEELLKHREKQQPEEGSQSQDQQQAGNQNQGNQDQQQPGNQGNQQQQAGQQNAADRHQPGGDNQQSAPQGGDQQAGGGQQGRGQNNPGEQSQSPSSEQSGAGDQPSDPRGNSTQKGGGQQQGGGQERMDGKDDNAPASGNEKPENGEGANGEQAGKTQSQESRDTPDAKPQEGTDAQGKGGRTKPNMEENMNPPEGGKDASNQGGDDSQEKGAGGAGNPEGSDKGSPKPYETAKPKTGKGDDQGPPQTPNDPGNPQSPSHSKNESDSQGDSSGDRSGGGKDGGGQSANQQGTGGAGQNTAADEGASQAPGSGRGEDSAKAGNKTEADGQTGQSGERAGAGSQSRQGESSQGQGTSGQNPGQQPQRDPNQQGQTQQGQQPQGPAGSRDQQQQRPSEQGQPDEGAGIGSNPNGQPGPSGAGAQTPNQPGSAARPPHNSSEPGGEDPNLKYANQATDLALRHLREELAKENPDPNLLKRINMSKEEAQSFLRRMEQNLDQAKQSGAAGEVARNRLRNLGLRPSSGGGQDDTLRGLRESAVTRPPASYREEYRSYTERGVRPSRSNK